MRQIKFRGKVNHYLNLDRFCDIKSGEWIYGDLSTCDDPCIILPEDGRGFFVEEDTVGQCMGRKDKNGREIYEDDVFTVDGKYPKLVGWDEETASFAVANVEDIRRQVEWDIWQHPDKRWWQDFGNLVEVIGNIHDDPELLTQKI